MPKQTLINLQSHDAQARKRGENVMFFQHRKCPCGAADVTMAQVMDQGRITQGSLRADITCEICNGYGYTWDTPILVRALINDVTTSNMKDLLATGLAAPGDMTMNPSPLAMRQLQLNDFDKIIFPARGGQPYDGDVVVRAQYDTDWDLLAYPAAVVESVAYKATEDATALTVCVEGATQDYTWEKLSDRLTWITGGPNRPADGLRVTVNYRCYYEWIVFVSPFVRMERNNQLGPRILLKKKHLIGLVR